MSAAYIFDVEGTLIDCVPDILKCWSETWPPSAPRYQQRICS